MADEKKSFSELLKDAPLAAQEDTVSLVGALERSNQPGKFVLAVAPGSSVTLDVDAVKGYQVLGGAVGQLLVQVDIDRARVPDSLPGGVTPALPTTGWRDLNTGSQDVKHQWQDYTGWPDLNTGAHDVHTGWDDAKHAWQDVTGATADLGYGGYGYGGDPWGGYMGPALGAAAPFALATQHQAPQSALAAMQEGPTPFGLPITGWRDLKNPWQDKRPWADATGRPPFLD